MIVVCDHSCKVPIPICLYVGNFNILLYSEKAQTCSFLGIIRTRSRSNEYSKLFSAYTIIQYLSFATKSVMIKCVIIAYNNTQDF